MWQVGNMYITELSSDTVLNCVLHRGVWVIFLFSAVLMVVTLVHFLLGVIAERAVCEPLQSPNNNQLLALVDKMVRLDKFFDSDVEINVSSIIRCVICLFFWRKHKLLAFLTLDKVCGFTSSPSMALGSTQPLTEMSSRKIPGG
jgi:hypothetical protein